MDSMNVVNVIGMVLALVLHTAVFMTAASKMAIRFSERLAVVETQTKNIMSDVRAVQKDVQRLIPYKH